MRKSVITLLFVFIASMGFSQEQTPLKKIIILPFANSSDTNLNPSSESLKMLMFRSLYSFIGIIPDLNTPDASLLTNIAWSDEAIPAIAVSNKADYIVFGNYKYTGSEDNPTIEISLSIWSKKENGLSLRQSYQATLGLEVIDALDSMLVTIIGNVLNTPMNIAYIRFVNFRIGDEPHDIFINNKYITTASNDQFFLSLKVLADKDYRIEMRGSETRDSVYQNAFHLIEGQSTNISVHAAGSVEILPIRNRQNDINYFLLLNDLLVVENERVANLPAGTNYTIRLVANQTNITFETTFLLHNGERHLVEVRDYYRKWHFFRLGMCGRFDLNEDSFEMGLDLGFDFAIRDKSWLGVNSSFNYIFSTGALKITPVLDFGYYFLGSRQTDWRLAGGLSAGVEFLTLDPDYGGEMNFSAGLFVEGQFKKGYLRVYSNFLLPDAFINFGADIGLRI